jgi:hypothetical protein
MVKALLCLLLMMILFPSVAGVGISPPQLRVTEAPMGASVDVAVLKTTNTGSEPAYMILRVGCLEKTRESKLRVICNNCSREIGIQRADLINGTCPFCGSTNLIFYDLPPDEVLDGIVLESSDHPLEKTENRIYKTIEKLQPGESASIDIYLNILDKQEYYNQHWEARIMALTITDMSKLSEFIVYGIDAKFLIDTPEKMVEPGKSGGGQYTLIGGMAAGAVAIVAVLFLIYMRVRRAPSPKKEKSDAPIVREGRKIL